MEILMETIKLYESENLEKEINNIIKQNIDKYKTETFGKDFISKVITDEILINKLHEGKVKNKLIYTQGIRNIGKTYCLIQYAKYNNLVAIVTKESFAQSLRKEFSYHRIHGMDGYIPVESDVVVDECVDIQKLIKENQCNIITGYSINEVKENKAIGNAIMLKFPSKFMKEHGKNVKHGDLLPVESLKDFGSGSEIPILVDDFVRGDYECICENGVQVYKDGYEIYSKMGDLFFTSKEYNVLKTVVEEATERIKLLKSVYRKFGTDDLNEILHKIENNIK
jgi:hypothetical protein